MSFLIFSKNRSQTEFKAIITIVIEILQSIVPILTMGENEAIYSNIRNTLNNH